MSANFRVQEKKKLSMFINNKASHDQSCSKPVINTAKIRNPDSIVWSLANQGLGVKNMNIQDITIITNGRWESTLNLFTFCKRGLRGVNV